MAVPGMVLVLVVAAAPRLFGFCLFVFLNLALGVDGGPNTKRGHKLEYANPSAEPVDQD